jgi:hypothetical protein
MCLWGLIDTSYPMGELFPKPLNLVVNGMQLKCVRAYIGTEETYHNA